MGDDDGNLELCNIEFEFCSWTRHCKTLQVNTTYTWSFVRPESVHPCTWHQAALSPRPRCSLFSVDQVIRCNNVTTSTSTPAMCGAAHDKWSLSPATVTLCLLLTSLCHRTLECGMIRSIICHRSCRSGD